MNLKFLKFKREIEQVPNIPICSLLDADAKIRTFFDVEADPDDQFPVLYFFMYDIEDKKKKRMSDIIVNYRTKENDIIDLIKFLKNWNFSTVKLNMDSAPKFWLDCDCLVDGFRFIKIKKEVYNEKEDNMYIDFFSSGGNFKRKQVIEVNITKQQAEVLANQLENFLMPKIKIKQINKNIKKAFSY